MKLRLLCLLLFTLHCSLVYAEEIDGKALLKKGKEELEGGRYEDAIKSLSTAKMEFPILGDYALFWLSEAYQETCNHTDSLKTIRTLLKNYPNSPLIKKARIREITEAQKVSEENIQQLFESFIKDYPDETEIKYAYAQWLKNCDMIDNAKSIFKEIYLNAGPFSELACSELNSSDIGTEDLIERASNLMKLRNFTEAESAYRTALEKVDGKLKNEILKNIGYSLFKQKRYLMAAEAYKDANDMFWRIRSLYRAGQMESFNSALDEFLKTEDKRAGFFLIAVASDKRREGKIEEALKTYQNVLELYPLEAEDALWGMGWTYFITGEYRKAVDVFAKLYEEYNDTRYLYWKARSLEASGEDASDIYYALRKTRQDFYSAISCVRKGGCSEESEDSEIVKSLNKSLPLKAALPSQKKFDRVETLLELGLKKEVHLELIHISKSISSIEDLLYLCSKFQDIGEYKYVVILSERILYQKELHHLYYPLAYWDTVEVISQKYNVEPFLILSVMREESRFDPHAKSTAGAIGLMQLMPQTALRLDKHLQLGIDNTSQIYNVTNNIHLGTFYLGTLIKEFNSPVYALAAYNAGENKLKEWMKTGNYKSIDEFIEDIPYKETRNYVKRVITTLLEYKRSSVDKRETEKPLENL